VRAFAELNSERKRAHVYFQYSVDVKNAVKAIPGARFVQRDEEGRPCWSLPLDLTAMRRLREVFGTGLQLGDAIVDWGKEAVKQEAKLHALAVADDWPLDDLVIAKKLPDLAEWFRPYQRADVKFLAAGSAMNLNEPRLGKTTEIIAAVYEAGLEVEGPHLVVAPQKALDSVWRMEIERWTNGCVFSYNGERKDDMDEFWRIAEIGRKPVWWLTTADMIRSGSYPDWDKWASFTIDEYHKTGLAEVKNVFPKAAATLPADRKYVLSGTPMGGKPIKLWGALHFLYPDLFTSKWRWAGQWLEIENTWGNHKKIKGILKGREDEFYAHLAPYTVRRLRTEVLPQLPEKQWIDVWCDMTAKQEKQYKTFAADAEIRIDEYHLSASGILAEYTRLKQFANSVCEVEVYGIDEETGKVDMKVKATPDSGKLQPLLERLAEVGIDPDEPEGDVQAIVTSQFRETAEMVHKFLTDKGIGSALFTGKTSKTESERIQRLFKHGATDREKLRVCCMVTTMGVGITLDNVESVHILDETWVPDDQDQVSDRAVNTSTLHQVNVFVYRSRGTVEEYIKDVNDVKFDINTNVLDLRRVAFKATMKGK
jgi:SNF2 family DNA or RNA helicase